MILFLNMYPWVEAFRQETEYFPSVICACISHTAKSQKTFSRVCQSWLQSVRTYTGSAT